MIKEVGFNPKYSMHRDPNSTDRYIHQAILSGNEKTACNPGPRLNDRRQGRSIVGEKQSNANVFQFKVIEDIGRRLDDKDLVSKTKYSRLHPIADEDM